MSDFVSFQVFRFVALVLVAVVISLWRKNRTLRELLRQAEYDPATGLSFQPRALRTALAALRRASSDWKKDAYVVAIFSDAKGLRTVNELCGHVGGDVYLRAHADQLVRLVRPGDLLFVHPSKPPNDAAFRRGERADEMVLLLVLTPEVCQAMEASGRFNELFNGLRSGEVEIPLRHGGSETRKFPLRPHLGKGVALFAAGSNEKVARACIQFAITEADADLEKGKKQSRE